MDEAVRNLARRRINCKNRILCTYLTVSYTSLICICLIHTFSGMCTLRPCIEKPKNTFQYQVDRPCQHLLLGPGAGLPGS